MYTLYDYLSSGNSYKVRLLLALRGIQFKRIDLDILKGETRSEQFLEKNPNGRIPTLQLDDGQHLWESNAILYYLADDTGYFPKQRLQRAQVLQWMFFEQYSHEPNIAVARFWKMHVQLDPRRKAQLEQKMQAGNAALKVMDSHLEQHNWFVGDHISIADIALYAYTHVADQGGFDLGQYAAINNWLDRVANQAGYVGIEDSGAGL